MSALSVENIGEKREVRGHGKAGGGPRKDGALELAILKYIHEHPSISNLRGNPSAILDVMDEFGATQRGFMVIGSEKRDFIIKLLENMKPTRKLFLEFGSFTGYSAIALSAALRRLRRDEKVKYITFELNPLNAAVTSSFIELAGLKDSVDVHVGPAAESLQRLSASGALGPGQVDCMLLDHWKDVYLSDLQVCERLGILRKGTVVLADNCLMPGALDYLAYTRKGVAEMSSEGLKYDMYTEDFVTANGDKDQIAVTTVV